MNLASVTPTVPTTRDVTRGGLMLGKLLTWSHTPQVRFFYVTAGGLDVAEDHQSQHDFESWLADQLGIPRNGVTIRPVKVL